MPFEVDYIFSLTVPVLFKANVISYAVLLI